MIKIPSSLDPKTPDNVFYPYLDLLTKNLLIPLLRLNQTRLKAVDSLHFALTIPSAVVEFPILAREFEIAVNDLQQAVLQQRRSKQEIAILYNELYNVYKQWNFNGKQLEKVVWDMWVKELQRVSTAAASTLGKPMHGEKGDGDIGPKHNHEPHGCDQEFCDYDCSFKTDLIQKINFLFQALGSDIVVEDVTNQNLSNVCLSLIRQLYQARPEYVAPKMMSPKLSSPTSSGRRNRWKTLFSWRLE